MKKISTLFKKNPENLGLVINEINPENQWVFDGYGFATRKYDGTASAIIDGVLYKRYDIEKGKKVPKGAIPCQEPDDITGHWPHWLACDRSKPEDKYFWEAFDKKEKWEDGTYELVGPKINGNKDKFDSHELIMHGSQAWAIDEDELNFEGLKKMLSRFEIEGFVFWHMGGSEKMCKIRRSDFGIK